MSRGELWVPAIGELAGTLADAAGAVAVLPDGTHLAIGQADGTVRCVDLATGETRWRGAEAHGPVLQALACSPDGRLVATSAEDRMVRIWEASTGALAGRWEQRATVFELRFAPGGERLATAGADDTVGVLRVGTGERVIACEGHEGWVQSVDWSPGGERLASAANDATLRIWDPVTGAELERREVGERALAVAWSPSGEWLAVGLEGGDVAMLDMRGPAAEALRFRADGGAVNGLAWSADGRRLATAGDETIGIWDAPAARSLACFPVDAPYARRVSWAPSGAFIAGSLCGDRVRLWDTREAGAAGA
jgi:WD40 repeat protein